MSKNGNAIWVPPNIKRRVLSLAERLEAAYSRGHGGIPPNELTGRVALWRVVERALDEYEGHLERSNGGSAREQAETI